jgi:hypothetical protein
VMQREREASKPQEAAAVVLQEPERLSEEEAAKKQAAHLAATLYDKGGMVSQQTDALRDHQTRQAILDEKETDQRAAWIGENAPFFRAKDEIKTARDAPDPLQDIAGQPPPEATIKTEPTPTPEAEQAVIVEAFFERQRAGIVNTDLDKTAAAFLSPEAFANAQHDAANRAKNKARA